jgi:hypothetical protein
MMEEQQQTKTGRIYKISSPQTDKVYIGSTTQSIYRRLQQHKKNYEQHQNGKYHYVSSFELVKYNDAVIEEIEEIQYVDKTKLYEREKYALEAIQNVVNKYRPITTTEERKQDLKIYYIDNKEKINEKKKIYNMDNKEKINEYNKKYVIENKEKIKDKQKLYNIENKEKKQKYRLENKEKLSVAKNLYVINNKEKIKEYKKKLYNDNKEKLSKASYCICGGSYAYNSQNRHNKTKKHIKYITNITNITINNSDVVINNVIDK